MRLRSICLGGRGAGRSLVLRRAHEGGLCCLQGSYQRLRPSLVQCRSFDVSAGVSVDASRWADLSLVQCRDQDAGSGVFVVVLNKGRTDHGPHRDQNVGLGVFVGLLLKGMTQPS